MLANIPYDWILWEMELPRLQVMDEPTTAQLGDPGTIHIPDKPTKRCGKNTASCTDLFPRPEFMRFSTSMTGWWFGTSILLSHILGIIILID